MRFPGILLTALFLLATVHACSSCTSTPPERPYFSKISLTDDPNRYLIDVVRSSGNRITLCADWTTKKLEKPSENDTVYTAKPSSTTWQYTYNLTFEGNDTRWTVIGTDGFTPVNVTFQGNATRRSWCFASNHSKIAVLVTLNSRFTGFVTGFGNSTCTEFNDFFWCDYFSRFYPLYGKERIAYGYIGCGDGPCICGYYYRYSLEKGLEYIFQNSMFSSIAVDDRQHKIVSIYYYSTGITLADYSDPAVVTYDNISWTRDEISQVIDGNSLTTVSLVVPAVATLIAVVVVYRRRKQS